MTVVDLSAHRLAPLEIDAGGAIYQVRPSADDLRRMGVFTAAAEQVLRAGAKPGDSVASIRDLIDPEDYDLLDSNETLARVQLGSETYDRLVADGVPAPDIYVFGRYSMYYHVHGKAYADAAFAIQSVAEIASESDAEFPKRSKSGRPTASASRTKTASTKGTGGSRSTSASGSTRRSSAKGKGRS